MNQITRRLIAELHLWRSLVTENSGGVPRYEVIPGAALNEIVTSTDALLQRIELRDENSSEIA